MKLKNPIFAAIVCSGAIVLIMLIIVVKIIMARQSSSSNVATKVVLSPEQQAVINELRQARAELEQAREALEIAKARAALDPNAQVSWLIVDRDHDVINTTDGKPILWGFHSDGMITWKYQ